MYFTCDLKISALQPNFNLAYAKPNQDYSTEVNGMLGRHQSGTHWAKKPQETETAQEDASAPLLGLDKAASHKWCSRSQQERKSRQPDGPYARCRAVPKRYLFQWAAAARNITLLQQAALRWADAGCFRANLLQLWSDLRNLLISPICSNGLTRSLTVAQHKSRHLRVFSCWSLHKENAGMPSSALEVGFPCPRISSTDSDTSKHGFVEIYQVFPQLRKHLRGQAMVHTNIHFVNANTSFFMYV